MHIPSAAVIRHLSTDKAAALGARAHAVAYCSRERVWTGSSIGTVTTTVVKTATGISSQQLRDCVQLHQTPLYGVASVIMNTAAGSAYLSAFAPANCHMEHEEALRQQHASSVVDQALMDTTPHWIRQLQIGESEPACPS